MEISPGLHILHRDESLLVINKPAGLPVLADGWQAGAPALLELLKQQAGRVWVVHRLDRGTSGVMVFALDADAHRSLSLQFDSHGVRKVYHALVCGVPGWSEHTSRQPLLVDVGHHHRTVVNAAKGKTCETQFRLLERFSGFCLLEAIPTTGRTHQVRAHAAALGFPLLGDELYGAPPSELLSRAALHAWSLEFTHPASGARLTFTAPHPPDLAHALEQLRSEAK